MMHSLFDEDGKQALIDRGVDAPLGIYVPAATRLDRLEADLVRGEATGLSYSAPTIKGLAKKLKVDAAVLQATIDEYNAHCDRNHDGDFAKDPQYLRPVRRGPFYAIDTRVHIFTSMGGIKINHRTEVLDTDGNVIPGLYAVGNCAGGPVRVELRVDAPRGGALVRHQLRADGGRASPSTHRSIDETHGRRTSAPLIVQRRRMRVRAIRRSPRLRRRMEHSTSAALPVDGRRHARLMGGAWDWLEASIRPLRDGGRRPHRFPGASWFPGARIRCRPEPLRNDDDRTGRRVTGETRPATRLTSLVDFDRSFARLWL